VVKPAQLQWSGFSCGKTRCNGPVPGRNRTRNRPANLEPLLTLGVTEEPPEPVYASDGIFEPQIRPQQPFRGNIIMLNGSSFFRTVKKGKLKVFKVSLYDINKAIEAKDLKERPLEEIVPKQYHEFLPLFNKVLADHCPPHRPGIDHEVRQKEGETPTWGTLYSMSRAELVVFKKWLEENMSKRLIRQSSSPFATPVFFAKNPDGGLRFCIDYRDINSKTMKNCYPLPLIKCKSTYACVRPHKYTYGDYRNMVANMDARDSRCRCIGKIIAVDLRLMASRKYRTAVTWPGSRAAMTLSLSLGAHLLGCINCIREKKRKH